MAVVFHNQPIWPFNEDDMTSFKFSFQDDFWKKYMWLPNTPPTSPSRSLGESSDSEESTTDEHGAERIQDINEINSDIELLQDVSENLDCTFDLNSNECSRTSDYFQTKLISDCMWSGSHSVDYLSRNLNSSSSPKCEAKSMNFEFDKSFPTPCPSPSPSVPESDYSSNEDCVDPTTVFPLSPLSLTTESISCHSESDEEIDVVTVDSKPLTIDIGVKRKFSESSKLSIKREIPVVKVNPESPAKVKKTLTRTFSDSSSITSSKSNSSSEESDVEIKERRRVTKDRKSHNVLEKMRRIDLKKCFERLRNTVPELEDKNKVSKLTILIKAASYIDFLYQEEIDLCKEKNLLENHKEMLLRKLHRMNSKK